MAARRALLAGLARDADTFEDRARGDVRWRE